MLEMRMERDPRMGRTDARALPLVRREGRGVSAMWKKIEGYPKYEVSNSGKVRNFAYLGAKVVG